MAELQKIGINKIATEIEVATLELPAVVARADAKTQEHFLQFFFSELANEGTRQGYARDVGEFLSWCDERGLNIEEVKPLHVTAYIRAVEKRVAIPTSKRKLSAIKGAFGYLTANGSLEVNPAAAVRGAKTSVSTGSTPIFEAAELKRLFEVMDLSSLKGLRDRALIGCMFFTFARVGAVLSLKVSDYRQEGKRSFLSLFEKGGKRVEVPVHHTLQDYLDDYVAAAGLEHYEPKSLLFRTLKKGDTLGKGKLNRSNVNDAIKHYALMIGLGDKYSAHSLRGSGITRYLELGGTLEKAKDIANHADMRTTALYDRRDKTIELDEIERLRF